MPQAVLVDELQSFFTAYLQAYRTREPQALLRFVDLPLTRVTSARQSVLEDDEAAQDSTARLAERFEANGVANARIATIEVGTATDDSVDVNVHWELLDEADEPLIAYDAGYSLVRRDRDWRISTIREDEQNRAFADAGWVDRDVA